MSRNLPNNREIAPGELNAEAMTFRVASGLLTGSLEWMKLYLCYLPVEKEQA